KLVGAVAYAWPYGKDPIAGITPFAQMHGFVSSFEKRDLAERDKAARIGLKEPLRIEGRLFDTVAVAQSPGTPEPFHEDALWMTPLQTPLAATGFTPHSLKLLRDAFPSSGLLPVQTGISTAKAAGEAKDIKIEPGAALAVSLVTGDFDISGIGTVTHV